MIGTKKQKEQNSGTFVPIKNHLVEPAPNYSSCGGCSACHQMTGVRGGELGRYGEGDVGSNIQKPCASSFFQRNLGNSYMQSIAENRRLLEPSISLSSVSTIQRKCSCGSFCSSCSNHEELEGMQAKLTIGSDNDVHEQEADRIAEQVMRMYDPSVQIIDQLNEGINIQRISTNSSNNLQSDSDINLNQSGGHPMSTSTRTFMEPRFGADFGHVRLHTAQYAHQTASRIHAKAFTHGNHIWLGKGESEENGSLMAHELTHTLQQRAVGHHTPVQRQPAESEKTSEITSRDVFPFPQESRVLLGRILDNMFFSILSNIQPEIAAALQAIDRMEASVMTASEDLFEARIGKTVTIPAQGEQPVKTLRNITLRLRRSGGTFGFSLTAQEGESPTSTSLMAYSGLTASRDNGGIVLSSGSGPKLKPQLLVSPGESGEVKLEVFTSNFMDQSPKWVRGLAPKTVEVIGINRLPDAVSEAEVQQAAEDIVDRQTSRRRTRSQGIDIGGGFQVAGEEVSPLLFTSWQIRFPIFGPTVGSFVQIPLEVQFQYAPSSSVLGGVSTGVTARIPTSVPVNFRLVTGVAGGSVDVPVNEESEGRAAFGFTLGAAAGVELGKWRVNLRYEHLFNVLENSPDANSLFLTGGMAF